MTSDTRSATLPPEFERTSETLRALLDEKLDSLGRSPSLKVWAFTDDLKTAINHWVEELSSIEGGRKKLIRRATWLQTLTSEESQFGRAWNGIQGILDELRGLCTGITENRDLSIFKTDFRFVEYIVNFKPTEPSKLNELDLNLERLLDKWDVIRKRLSKQAQQPDQPGPLKPLTAQQKKAIDRLKRAAKPAYRDVQTRKSEGCQTLLWWSNDPSLIAADTGLIDLFPESMRGDETLRKDYANLQRDCYEWVPKQSLENMGSAVQSMVESVAGEAGRIRPDAREKKPREHPPIGEVKPREMIVFHADRLYSVGDANPFEVSENEDNVLQAFLDRPAMDTASLIERSGCERPGHVLRKLATKYDGVLEPFIKLPGGKAKGGYAIELRCAKQVPNRR